MSPPKKLFVDGGTHSELKRALLRAVCWEVLPIPKAVAGSDKAKEVSRNFIASNEKQDSGATNVEHRGWG